MNHDELMEIVPAYALDAVSPDEEMQLRSHLEDCRECARLFEFHLETAGMLALTAEPKAGSSKLREQLLSRASSERQIRAISPAERWALPAPRKPWVQKVAVFAAAAALLFAALGGWMALKVRNQNEVIGKQQQALGLIASPGVQTVSMREGDVGEGAQGKVFVPETGDQGAVVIKGLKDSGEKIYALWLVRDGDPIPIENFEPDENGEAVLLVDRPVTKSSVMAVTLEPKMGTTAPIGPTVLST